MKLVRVKLDFLIRVADDFDINRIGIDSRTMVGAGLQEPLADGETANLVGAVRYTADASSGVQVRDPMKKKARRRAVSRGGCGVGTGSMRTPKGIQNQIRYGRSRGGGGALS